MNRTQALRNAYLRALRSELNQAKKHLARWEYLGRRLGRTSSRGWSATKKLREQGVRTLEALIERVQKAG
jgi:hypothetical protein